MQSKQSIMEGMIKMSNKNNSADKMSTKEMVSNIGFAVKYLLTINRSLFVLRFILLTADVITSLMSALFLSYVLNTITSENVGYSTIVLSIFYFAVATFALSILRRYIRSQNNKQTEITSSCIKLNLGNIVSQMKYSDIENPRVRDFISLASSTNSFSNIIDNFTNLVSAIVNVITYGTIVIYVQPLILILVFVVVVIQTVISKMRLNNRYKWRTIQAPIFRKLNYLINLLSDPRCGKEIRVNQLQNHFAEKSRNYFEVECIPPVKKSVFDENKLYFITEISKVTQKFLIYLFLAIKVVYENMKIGDFTFYLTGADNLTVSLTGIIESCSNMLASGMFAREFRYCVELAAERQKMLGNAHIDHNQPISIEFRDVSFKYPETDKYVLKHISFKINENESLSLVGINGSGKTTMVKLLCRFYEPTSGGIYVGGVNIRDISPNEYEQILGVVFQDYKLFSFTIRENVSMGDEQNEQFLLRSIEKSGLSEKLNQLGNGIDTSIFKDFDESGIEFSGGEGQKLAIARAIYKDAPILILDEPTSSLDPIAEYDIFRRFYEMTVGKTSIFISHRLSSTRFTNKIAVLDDGELREYGTHNELMNLNDGLYKNMFNMQAQLYKE